MGDLKPITAPPHLESGQVSTWRTTVWREIRWVEDVLARSEMPADSPEGRPVEQYLESARAAVDHRPKGWSRFKAWWTGADIEAAWVSVHAAKQALFMVAPENDIRSQVPLLRSKLASYLKKQDSQRPDYEKWLDDQSKANSKINRSSLETVRTAVDAASDQRFATLRAFRNTLYGASAGLLVILTVLIFDPPNDPFLPICPPPAATSDEADGSSTKAGEAAEVDGDAAEECPRVWQIELVGALGGALAAVAALSRIRISTGPYGVRIAQAVLKVPAGAAFGLVGAMLMQSKSIDALEAQGLPELFAYVVIFGYAQQTITRLIDQKAKSLATGSTPEPDGAEPGKQSS